MNAAAESERVWGVDALVARVTARLGLREGVAMTALDWVLASGFTLLSFVICFAWVWYPSEKIFDEIYYARAGEEYLKHLDVSGWGPFEFTHPPLTKLLITLSMLLFGGLHGGDDALGWRFLNVVVGALTVGLIYLFAKRLTASTPFAAAAALMLTCDGFHFVQSRIATPEITVGFLTLLVLYTFYRLWQASVDAPAAELGRRGRIAVAVCTASGALLGLVAAFVVVPHASGPITVRGVDFVGWAQVVAFGWMLALGWLIGRTLVAPRYAAVPAFVDRDARTWWIATVFAVALLADAKWNGLTTIALLWALAGALNLQRFRRSAPAFGSPFGIPVDVLVTACVVVGGFVYTLSYVPYFTEGHGFVDMVAMQHDMYRYHATLVATHPYSSVWWQWPLLDRPILYYANYTHVAAKGAADCCAATIRALPNPFVWLAGLISVPSLGWQAIRKKNAGYALLVLAYLAQWLPWAISPRLTFEYHFFPNLTIIVLATAIVLQEVWRSGIEQRDRWALASVGVYLAAVVIGFAYFYPILAGTPIPYQALDARLWSPTWI